MQRENNNFPLKNIIWFDRKLDFSKDKVNKFSASSRIIIPDLTSFVHIVVTYLQKRGIIFDSIFTNPFLSYFPAHTKSFSKSLRYFNVENLKKRIQFLTIVKIAKMLLFPINLLKLNWICRIAASFQIV